MAHQRYENLIPNTKDLINCIIPTIAANFAIQNCVETIPQEIRMRRWDCEKRDHCKDESEDDPRNWGVQFLKELLTISRIKKEHGESVEDFHSDLRRKMQNNLRKPAGEKHPWIRLVDIKWLRERYEAGLPIGSEEDSEAPAVPATILDDSSSESSAMAQYIAQAQAFSKRPGHPSHILDNVNTLLKRHRAETPPHLQRIKKEPQPQDDGASLTGLSSAKRRKTARHSVGGFAPRNNVISDQDEYDPEEDHSLRGSSAQMSPKLVFPTRPTRPTHLSFPPESAHLSFPAPSAYWPPRAPPTPSTSSRPLESGIHAGSYVPRRSARPHHQSTAPKVPQGNEGTLVYQHAPSYNPHRLHSQASGPNVADDNEEPSLYQLQLELEVAEAELKAAKLRLRVVDGKRRAAAAEAEAAADRPE